MFFEKTLKCKRCFWLFLLLKITISWELPSEIPTYHVINETVEAPPCNSTNKTNLNNFILKSEFQKTEYQNDENLSIELLGGDKKHETNLISDHENDFNLEITDYIQNDKNDIKILSGPFSTTQNPSLISKQLPLVESFIQEEDAERDGIMIGSSLSQSQNGLKQKFMVSNGQNKVLRLNNFGAIKGISLAGGENLEFLKPDRTKTDDGSANKIGRRETLNREAAPKISAKSAVHYNTIAIAYPPLAQESLMPMERIAKLWSSADAHPFIDQDHQNLFYPRSWEEGEAEAFYKYPNYPSYPGPRGDVHYNSINKEPEHDLGSDDVIMIDVKTLGNNESSSPKGKRQSGITGDIQDGALGMGGAIFAKQKLLLQAAALKHLMQVGQQTLKSFPVARATSDTVGNQSTFGTDLELNKNETNSTNVSFVNDNRTIESVEKKSDVVETADSNKKFCVTKECVEIAASLSSSMDTSVDPCENFYEYACKKRDKENVIPEGEVKINRFTELIHSLNVKVKGMMEEPIDETNETKSVIEAKYFYKSCINESFVEIAKTEPLIKFLHKYGGWPVLEATWPEVRFSLIDIIADLRKYRIQILIKEDLNPDKRNSSLYIIEIDQPKFRFQREAYLKGAQDETMTKYWLFMVNVAEYLGAERQMAEAEMMEVLKFEILLANISLPMKSRIYMANFYKKMNIEELSNQIPEIDWLKYLSHLMPTINKEDLVGVMALDYLKKLGKLLPITPKRVLANFIMWKAVQSLIQYTNRDLVDLEKMFNKMVGSGTDRARWKICVYNTLKFFPLVNGNLFVKKYFGKEVKESVYNMSKEIKQVFNQRLPQIDWMDNQTRIAAQKKADFIIKKIAYPSVLLNDDYLANLTKKVSIKKETYFQNILSLEAKVSEVEHTYFRKYVNRTEWKERILEVNAYYHWNKNYIIIPAGILQPPFFKIGYPKSVNYARIGFIIGHETTHAFDSLGSQYNEFGNQKEWWSKEITQKFKEKAACIIEQYGNYTVPEVGLNLNGDASQSENIADNGGIKQAYVAYKNAEKMYGEDYLLPGLDLTHDQIFFLSFAQIWCGLTRKEKILTDIQTLSHPYEKFRVIGTLSNFPTFAEAYKCPLGSTMNPYKKCSVW